ncbi:hypothetical protein [Pelagibacterium xiamenense]|uniref:hypothetical protein n=1 Tax=Pelagibacterium xiamenense TaxID=2901140 RepID=UPI001E2B17B6|nr:hypothetical protein [Pelagibacterium xiamenense]MCD7059662.1 hypothetical protein [Pelagibacterium xiamenense]
MVTASQAQASPLPTGITAELLSQTLTALLVAIFLSLPIFLFSATGGTLFLVTSAIALIAISIKYTRVQIGVYFFLLIFQSTVIAITINGYSDRSELSTAQGLQFLTLSIFGFHSWIHINNMKQIDIVTLSKLLTLFFLLCSVYLLYGLIENGAQNAIIYFRSSISSSLLICFGLYVGTRLSESDVKAMFTVCMIAAIIFTIIEMIATKELYEFINAFEFFSVKYEGRYNFYSLESVIEFSKRPLLNLPIFRDLGLTTFRVSGPNMHSISLAYLSMFGLLLFFSQKNYILATLCAAILIAIQAKGPIIILLISFSFYYARSIFSKRIWKVLLALTLASYATFGIWYGMQTRDFHVLGLIGGLEGFLSNPIGHGLGAGGNLSRIEFDWQDFQNAGAAAFGVESAVGVLLYQVGIATFALVGFYIWFANYTLNFFWKRHSRLGLLLSLAFATTVVNGIFQEEAYNPFALGQIGLMLAVIVGSTLRFEGQSDKAPVEAPRPRSSDTLKTLA